MDETDALPSNNELYPRARNHCEQPRANSAACMQPLDLLAGPDPVPRRQQAMTKPLKTVSLSAGPIALVLATITLQLVSAWLLAGVAQRKGLLDILALAAIGLCIALNLVRFVIWRVIHRRYPLSHVYPLTALFFPLIVALSYFRGDPVSFQQLAGTALITLGALILAPARQSAEERP